MNTNVECPECGATVDLSGIEFKGEIVPCSDCGVELEVMSLDPLSVALAPKEELDWGE